MKRQDPQTDVNRREMRQARVNSDKQTACYLTREREMLFNESGMTIVEILISFVIIVIAVVGIYLGLLYAESQINRNYHDRVAALAASGECDWQYYYKTTYRDYDYFGAREITIREYPDQNRPPLRGTMTMEISENTELIEGRRVRYETLVIQVTWEEPLAGQRVMVIQEDFFQ
jgi:hypothetical protein